VKFFFLGVLPQHRVEKIGGLGIGVPLQCFDATLVEGDSFEIGRTPLRRGRLRRRLGAPGRSGRRRSRRFRRPNRPRGRTVLCRFGRSGRRPPLLGHKPAPTAIVGALGRRVTLAEGLGPGQVERTFGQVDRGFQLVIRPFSWHSRLRHIRRWALAHVRERAWQLPASWKPRRMWSFDQIQ
jgi:hypothetical protein